MRISDDATGRPTLRLKFNEKGAQRLKKATADMRWKQIALLINGEIFSVATVLEMISRDLALMGKFNEDELRQLVDSLKGQVRRKGVPPNPNRVGT